MPCARCARTRRITTEARAITLSQGEICRRQAAPILIACAGTSDLQVAEEAAVTAELMGNTVDRLYDVGVAGIHRLLERADRIQTRARDHRCRRHGRRAAERRRRSGAACPVIAVPTSVGYGASFGGIAALLGMLNSCANGIAVVNIDNGFGAAAMAARSIICDLRFMGSMGAGFRGPVHAQGSKVS